MLVAGGESEIRNEGREAVIIPLKKVFRFREASTILEFGQQLSMFD